MGGWASGGRGPHHGLVRFSRTRPAVRGWSNLRAEGGRLALFSDPTERSELVAETRAERWALAGRAVDSRRAWGLWALRPDLVTDGRPGGDLRVTKGVVRWGYVKPPRRRDMDGLHERSISREPQGQR